MTNLDGLQPAERRTLYKAYRSAHDGICPCCGSRVVKTGTSLPSEPAHTCTGCEFHMTLNECQVVAQFGPEFIGDTVNALASLRRSMA